MTDTLTAFYLLCFNACAWPSVIRMVRRGSSADLSIWREWLLLGGVTAQFLVMLSTGADWRVWLSPLFSGASVIAMLVCISWYR